MEDKKVILTKTDIDRILKRVSIQIVELVKYLKEDWNNFIIIGIKKHGIPICERIVDIIEKNENIKLKKGILDVSLYRDDLTEMKNEALIHSSEIYTSLKGKMVFIVDDICNSGMTIYAALNAILDHGKPKIIKYFSLVKAKDQILPVNPDLIGVDVELITFKNIRVRFEEIDGTDEVYIYN